MKITARPHAIALLVPFGLSFALAGCGSSHATIDNPVPVSSAPTISLERLRSAPALATVGSVPLHLSAVLIRNLMPTVGTDASAKGVSGSVTVSASNDGAVPTGLRLISAYTVQNDTSGSFGTLTINTHTDATNEGLNAYITSGPILMPGTQVSVVVLFQDAAGTQYLVQAPSVTIIGAD